MQTPNDPNTGEFAPKIKKEEAQENESLYEVRQKIYPRAVSGTFSISRWALVWITQLFFYGACWLSWNDRQALLFNLAERKFYIFGFVFLPQDAFYLAVLLIISAYSLFLFTAIAGRLWCGYACPQTVYTEIFLWIEEKIEGDRSHRMKLDAQGVSRKKVFTKALKYAVWVLFSLWTGVTFVGYFTPVKALVLDLAHGLPGGWSLFWIMFYGGFTYLMAGVMREQVCKYMCPYARFQSVMFDNDTLVITYDAERGEPRGARKRGADAKPADKGDCIDCNICVQVCPTGIDIRKGLQYECIGCAACIDACDKVMDQMSYPQGLIRYSSENALKKHWGRKEILAHALRPRILIYSAVLCIVLGAFSWSLLTRSAIRVDIIKDRSVISREVEDGQVENVFIVKMMNTNELARTLSLSVQGIEGIKIRGQTQFLVPPLQSRSVIVRVRIPGGKSKAGSYPVYFKIQPVERPDKILLEKTIFIVQE